MEKIVVAAVLLALSAVLSAPEEASFLKHLELIRSVSEKRNVKSIVLAASISVPGSHKLHKFQSNLMASFKHYTALWKLEQLHQSLQWNTNVQQTILVVVHFNEKAINELAKLSKVTNMAKFIWLMTSSHVIDPSQIEDISIPFDCQFIVAKWPKNGIADLTELYKINNKSQTISSTFGRWSEKNGLETTNEDLFTRRKNFNGHAFTFVVQEAGPCSEQGLAFNRKRAVECVNYQLWKEFERVYNFTTKEVIESDLRKYAVAGSPPPLHSFRGDGAESTVGLYPVLPRITLKNQLLWPIRTVTFNAASKCISQEVSLSSYFRPLVGSLWCGILVWIGLSGVTLLVIKYATDRYIKKSKASLFSYTSDYLLTPCTAICAQGYNSVPSRYSERVALLMLFIVPAVLLPAHSGGLISSLTVPLDTIPFRDLEGFVKDGTYRLGAINNSYMHMFLLINEAAQMARDENLIATSMPKIMSEGVRRICQERFSLVSEQHTMNLIRPGCCFFLLDKPLTKTLHAGMILRKGSPLKELLNRCVQKILYAGIYQTMNDRVGLAYDLISQNEEFHPKQFTFKEVSALFAIFGGLSIVSVFLLFFEIHYFRRVQSKR